MALLGPVKERAKSGSSNWTNTSQYSSAMARIAWTPCPESMSVGVRLTLHLAVKDDVRIG